MKDTLNPVGFSDLLDFCTHLSIFAHGGFFSFFTSGYLSLNHSTFLSLFLRSLDISFECSSQRCRFDLCLTPDISLWKSLNVVDIFHLASPDIDF
jgi:hypothetical protein